MVFSLLFFLSALADSSGTLSLTLRVPEETVIMQTTSGVQVRTNYPASTLVTKDGSQEVVTITSL